MQGNAELLMNYMDGNKNRFIVPVYQRKYEWKTENCLQLYKDLCKLSTEKRPSHFFGSIVSNIVPNKGMIEYHIIDGQQRITTITLLLLAIHNLLNEKKLHSEDDVLQAQIYETYLINKFRKGDEKYRLVPVEADREAFHKLFGDPVDYDQSSNLTINYTFFHNLLLKEEITIDDLIDAINKLEIINITLEHGDNAQLIFESLNSTGLALEEGDKIRNYVLMGQEPDIQEYFYENYWMKIEECTQDHVSDFVRDYLSIKQQSTPNINAVYSVFKNYVSDSQLSIKEVLEDLLKYARFYEKLLRCKSGLGLTAVDDCLYRIKKLEIVVVRPFFMEVLRLNNDKKLSAEDVLNVFLVTENYLFRRNICDVPTNALNKIFVTINKEVIRLDNTTDYYVAKFIYVLESKRESSRFPTDEEFAVALAAKQVYQMRGRYKAYLFERFENHGTVEVKDVYTLLDNNVYTIEHIMPQHLTSEWQKDLGPDYQAIHSEWLHRLANLTLTGYNPNLSNKTFLEKRDSSDGGYKNSGLRMNQHIAQLSKWGLDELVERNGYMVSEALNIWKYPETTFVPAEKEYDSCTLDDEDVDLTGRYIVKFGYKNAEQPVGSWAEMFEAVVASLHQQDKSVLTSIAFNNDNNEELHNNISNKADSLRSPLKVDDNIYIEKNTNTSYKLLMLRRLFSLYHVDPMDLVFYLRDETVDKAHEEDLYEVRKKYWTCALPIIQERNAYNGAFAADKPNTGNATGGAFGIGGFSINCIANYNEARVELWLASGNKAKNKEAFDLLYSAKDEIEKNIDRPLTWSRAEEYKASYIYTMLENVGINDESSWQKMAEFHAEMSKKFYDACVKKLNDHFMGVGQYEKMLKAQEIANCSQAWVMKYESLHIDLYKCSRSYTRFTSDFMDDLLPCTPDNLSGWGTENHYFYEIRNINNTKLALQLALSSKNVTDEQKAVMETINTYFSSQNSNPDWEWRTNFRTDLYLIDLDNLQTSINEILDVCYEEMKQFEASLKKKLDTEVSE